MFENLRIALAKKGISIKQYAEILGVGDKTVQNKMSGRTDFTFTEFKKTCILLPEYNADFLFTEKKENERLCDKDENTLQYTDQKVN